MISRRDKLLNCPFQQRRYEQHRQKVKSAKPTIDFRTPPTYPHVTTKPKKQQFERERLKRIEEENVRLLQKLGDIMRTNRLENFWKAPRPNFLNREKLFQTRPRTSEAKFTDTSEPSSYEISPYSTQKPSSSKTALRCLSCSGRLEKSKMIQPEARIPWEPPRKSISTSAHRENFTQLKKCLHCGHLKKPID